MADDEPLLTNPPTQDVARHVRDYARLHQAVQMGRDRLPASSRFVVLMIIS